MGAIKKVLGGNWQRRTRAHSEKGDLAIRHPSDLVDASRSLVGASRRLLLKQFPEQPWLTYPAIRFLQKNLPADARIFEFGGGMSTLYFSRRYPEVYTVENNPDWFERIQRTSRSQAYLLDGEDYYTKIHAFPEAYFDLVVIDGKLRFESFFAACDHVKQGGLMVVDDTDKSRNLERLIRQLDEWLEETHEFDVTRLVGWVPGSFWVKETTIAQKTTNRSSEQFRPSPREGWVSR